MLLREILVPRTQESPQPKQRYNYALELNEDGILTLYHKLKPVLRMSQTLIAVYGKAALGTDLRRVLNALINEYAQEGNLLAPKYAGYVWRRTNGEHVRVATRKWAILSRLPSYQERVRLPWLVDQSPELLLNQSIVPALLTALRAAKPCVRGPYKVSIVPGKQCELSYQDKLVVVLSEAYLEIAPQPRVNRWDYKELLTAVVLRFARYHRLKWRGLRASRAWLVRQDTGHTIMCTDERFTIVDSKNVKLIRGDL